MRKALVTLLALLLVCGALPAQSMAEDPTTIVIFQNTGKLSAAGATGSTEEAYKMVQDKILEETGILVEVIVPPTGSGAEKLNAMLASRQEMDVFQGSWVTYYDAVQPVTELLDEYGENILAAWSEDTVRSLTRQGEIIGMPRQIAPARAYPTYVRQDWLDKLGLAAPTTIEEMEAMLKAFLEEDPAGNGQTIPMGTYLPGLNGGLSAAFTGKGYGNYLDAEDNRIKPVELLPGYRDFIEKMAEWYDKGYMYVESFTTDRARYNELIIQGNFGSFVYWASLVPLQYPYMLDAYPEAKYVLTDLASDKGFAETHVNASPNAMLIPRYSEKAEAVVKLANWAYADVENHLTMEMGIEGVHWNWVDKEKGLIEQVENSGYMGDFVITMGITETWFSFDDPLRAMQNEWLRGPAQDMSRTQSADDWFVIYDTALIDEAAPMRADIKRMLEEEVIKFITGVRDLSEWDMFIEELYAIGLDAYIDAHTAQYNEFI